MRRLSKTGIPLTGSNEIAARRFKSPEHFALAYAFFAFKKGRSYATGLPPEPAYDCHWLRWAALPTGASSNSGAKSLRRGGVDWAKVLEPIFVVPDGLTESSITKGLELSARLHTRVCRGALQRRELKLATVQQFLTTGLYRGQVCYRLVGSC